VISPQRAQSPRFLWWTLSPMLWKRKSRKMFLCQSKFFIYLSLYSRYIHTSYTAP
jgi:hypothetical protein